MADYRDFVRETDPKHCGSGEPHEQHGWHGSGVGMHLCTGNVPCTRNHLVQVDEPEDDGIVW